MPNSRCGHFSLLVEELRVSDASVTLRVPIRRCALAERMITVLARSDDGRTLARKLLVATGSNASLDGDTIDLRKIIVAFGPDLDSIHPNECTLGRCKESCTPGYKNILLQYGFQEASDSETGDGCLDAEEIRVVSLDR